MDDNDSIITKLLLNTTTTTTASTTFSSFVELAEYLIKGAITFSTIQSTTGMLNALGPVKGSLALLSSVASTNTSSGTMYPYDYIFPTDTTLDNQSSLLHINDNKEYLEVERNAEKIYDFLDREHEKQSSVSGLVVPSMETAKKLDEILRKDDKKTMYEALTALQEIIQEIQNDKEREDTFQLKRRYNVNL